MFFIKKIFFIFFLFLMSALAHAETLDKVVAVVNDDVITTSELDKAFAPLKKQCESTYSGDDLRVQIIQTKRQVLERMIEDILILQDAKKKNIEVAEEEVTEALDQIKLKFETKETFLKALEQQEITEDGLKEKLKKQMIGKKYRRLIIGRSIQIYPSDALDYYQTHKQEYVKPEEVKVAQIFIAKGDDQEFAKKKMDEIMRSIENGESFDELVKTFAQNTQGVKSGDLGYVKKGQILRPLEDIVFNMNIGDVSPVIETNIGFHIVKVLDKKASQEIPFNDAQEQIKNIIFTIKAEKKYKEMLEKMKKDSYIEIKAEMS